MEHLRSKNNSNSIIENALPKHQCIHVHVYIQVTEDGQDGYWGGLGWEIVGGNFDVLVRWDIFGGDFEQIMVEERLERVGGNFE